MKSSIWKESTHFNIINKNVGRDCFIRPVCLATRQLKTDGIIETWKMLAHTAALHKNKWSRTQVRRDTVTFDLIQKDWMNQTLFLRLNAPGSKNKTQTGIYQPGVKGTVVVSLMSTQSRVKFLSLQNISPASSGVTVMLWHRANRTSTMFICRHLSIQVVFCLLADLDRPHFYIDDLTPPVNTQRHEHSFKITVVSTRCRRVQLSSVF